MIVKVWNLFKPWREGGVNEFCHAMCFMGTFIRRCVKVSKLVNISSGFTKTTHSPRYNYFHRLKVNLASRCVLFFGLSLFIDCLLFLITINLMPTTWLHFFCWNKKPSAVNVVLVLEFFLFKDVKCRTLKTLTLLLDTKSKDCGC